MTPRTELLLARLHNAAKVRVLFVCLGNICRSPAAEGLMRDVVERHVDSERWEIDSAGIGDWHTGQLPDKRMRVHANRRGYNLTHHARQVKSSDFENFDLIIAMDSQNESDLRDLAPSPEACDKIVRMNEFVTLYTRYDHIPDPYYEGAEGFELVLDLLENSTESLYQAITAN